MFSGSPLVALAAGTRVPFLGVASTRLPMAEII